MGAPRGSVPSVGHFFLVAFFMLHILLPHFNLAITTKKFSMPGINKVLLFSHNKFLLVNLLFVFSNKGEN